MKKIINKLPFKYFPLTIILVYAPFHLLEEAWFNFPQWMFEHYKLPQPLSYPHWLINNFVFLVVLVAGLMIFFKNPKKNIAFGIGIIFWALMNSMEHLIFSLYDLQLSPGFFTGMLFLVISLTAIIKLKLDNNLNLKMILKSFLIAIGYWGASFLVIIASGKYLVQQFPYS